VLKVSAVHPDGFRSDQNKVIEHQHLIVEEYEVQDGDLLMTRANTPQLVGMVCLVNRPQQKLMLCDKTLRLRENPAITDRLFLFLSLQLPHIRSQIESAATGTSMSMKNISQDAIRHLLLAVPKLDEQINIGRKVNSIDQRLSAERQQVESLRMVKAGLMDDLLAGRVRVTPLQSAKEYEQPRSA
jgi:type I restriction enzyme S subunit